METSIYIARLIGPLYTIVGIGMILNADYYRKVMDDFTKNTALVLYGGMFALIFGLLILSIHNTWAPNWTSLITLFGWGGLIKGAWLVVYPKSVQGFMKGYQKNKNLLTLHSAAALIIGIAFIYLGYFSV